MKVELEESEETYLISNYAGKDLFPKGTKKFTAHYNRYAQIWNVTGVDGNGTFFDESDKNKLEQITKLIQESKAELAKKIEK